VQIFSRQSAAGWQLLLRDTLRDPMLWFLLVTSSMFAIIGEIKEAVILTLAMIPLAGMDFFLRRRTQCYVPLSASPDNS
jgi:Ca2+-transporting ATPase